MGILHSASPFLAIIYIDINQPSIRHTCELYTYLYVPLLSLCLHLSREGERMWRMCWKELTMAVVSRWWQPSVDDTRFWVLSSLLIFSLGPLLPYFLEYAVQRRIPCTWSTDILHLNMTNLHEHWQWSSPVVYASLLLSGIFTMAFLAIELFIASEPVLAPSILQQRVPVLVGMSNFLVATSNFSVWYNFPTWFQTVLLTSASEAGKSTGCQFQLLEYLGLLRCV